MTVSLPYESFNDCDDGEYPGNVGGNALALRAGVYGNGVRQLDRRDCGYVGDARHDNANGRAPSVRDDERARDVRSGANKRRYPCISLRCQNQW